MLKLFGIDRALTQDGMNYGARLAFSAVFGFGGAIVSLLISKRVAKWSTGAQVIDGSEGAAQGRLVETVHRLAERAGIGMPEVAIYDGAPNAFATGAFKNSALVAVSTGLLHRLRAGDRVRGAGVDHRRVVLAPARVPRRRRLGRVPRLDAADGARWPGSVAPSRARCPRRYAPSASPTGRAGWRCSRAIRRLRSASRRSRRSAVERRERRLPGAAHNRAARLVQ